LRNVLWDKYYAPTLAPAPAPAPAPAVVRTHVADFNAVYSDVRWQDAFYRFLQNVYRLYPEDRFHTLIKESCAALAGDEAIYRRLQERIPTIKPFLSEATYALPSLSRQKKEMARQTLELLGDKRDIDGYLELGTTGRYASELRKHLRFSGPLVFVNEAAPTFSPVDIVERGRLARLGSWLPLADYTPISDEVADESLDLVSCYIGLHHIDPPKLEPFVASIHRILRPGGLLILRDHDVTTPEMFTFVSLAHTVFNAGLGLPWEENARELRHFVSIAEWVRRLKSAGFADTGKRLLQAHDPSDNALMAFVREERHA
jgi:SAM-dependent methyltransferase